MGRLLGPSPERRRDRQANREKSNIISTADLVRGMDVFEVSDLPAPVKVAAPTTSAPDPFDPNAGPAGRP